MSKYTPIEQHLKYTKKEILRMTFNEVETIINDKLPKSARKFRAWWSNDASTHTQALAWLKAGYITERVDMKDETLVFRREEILPSQKKDMQTSAPDAPHPLFGLMKGLITIPDDLDLTKPADPEWGKNTYGSGKE